MHIGRRYLNTNTIRHEELHDKLFPKTTELKRHVADAPESVDAEIVEQAEVVAEAGNAVCDDRLCYPKPWIRYVLRTPAGGRTERY